MQDHLHPYDKTSFRFALMLRGQFPVEAAAGCTHGKTWQLFFVKVYGCVCWDVPCLDKFVLPTHVLLESVPRPARGVCTT